STVYLQKASIADVLNAIDLATGVQTATLAAGGATYAAAAGATKSSIATTGVLALSTGTNSDLSITATGNALSVLGLTGNTGNASTTLGSVAAGGVIGGTLTSAATFSTASTPIADVSAQAVRANLVSQYNNILAQITTTAQDASFNGVNLLGGDTLKLTFND